MNSSDLKNLSKSSKTAHRILQMIANRRRNTVYTAFSGLRADLKTKDKKEVNKDEFNETFEKLEAMGIGTIEKSPRGTYQGFEWKTPIRKVAWALTHKITEAPQKKAAKAKSDLVTVVVLKDNKPVRSFEIEEGMLPQGEATQL